MIKTYVASLEFQYLLDNQLVSNYLLVFFYCLLTLVQYKLFYFYYIYLNSDIFMNVIYDDYLIIFHT
jgi:hypothetical protein